MTFGKPWANIGKELPVVNIVIAMIKSATTIITHKLKLAELTSQ